MTISRNEARYALSLLSSASGVIIGQLAARPRTFSYLDEGGMPSCGVSGEVTMDITDRSRLLEARDKLDEILKKCESDGY